MKLLKYNLIARVNTGTEEAPMWKETKGADVTMGYSEANLAIAQSEAWQGIVEVVDDGEPEVADTPTQLDIIEAQVAYTAMMTDTMLGV